MWLGDEKQKQKKKKKKKQQQQLYVSASIFVLCWNEHPM